MNIDEKKIEKLIENEIKAQVAKKMKLVGRDTIMKIYKESVSEVVKEILIGKSKEMESILLKDMISEKDRMQSEILNRISDRFVSSIQSAFINQDRYYDDYDSEYDY